MATRAEILDWVRQQTLVESDDFADAKIVNIINQAIRDVSIKFPWPWLATSANITTVASQQSYAVPADYLATHTIVDSDAQRRLREMAPTEAWEAYGGSFPSSTVAAEFFMWGNSIYLVPTPSANDTDRYVHFYYKTPTTLANDGDSPEFDARFHLVLADYVIARVWEREEDYTKASAAQSAYDRGVEQMARHYLNRAQDRPMVFGESRGYGRGGTRRNLPWLDGV